MTDISPKNIVTALDRHIVGQKNGKRAVAIALRNRWRRLQLPEEIGQEITPKNILMIGPTGVGKTEIARRLARLADAPFLKVEATKFTEVGYVGRDVESIIRDLTSVALKEVKDRRLKLVHGEALDRAEEKILSLLLPRPKTNQKNNDSSGARQLYRKKLRQGELDDKEIELDLKSRAVGVDIMTPPGMEEMAGQLQDMFSQFGRNNTQKRRMTIKNALKALTDEEAERLISDEEIKQDTIQAVESRGIVFLDELDKVCRRESTTGSDVSREGVQRDLLPLIEGTTVQTKFGNVRTEHILFIASGSFHHAKPSDLIPELQGRLPIRVELQPLTPGDFSRILTEPDHSLIQQYQALLKTEGVDLKVQEDGINAIAELAFTVNEQTENIGARRLHTLLERLLESVLFTAGDGQDNNLEIDRAYVQEKLSGITKDRDLSRYVL